MPGFPLAAIGAGLGLFAKQYQEQQAAAERNKMLQMQLAMFQQQMQDRQKQQQLASAEWQSDLASLGGGVEPTPGGASAVPPIGGGMPFARSMPKAQPDYGAPGEYGVGQAQSAGGGSAGGGNWEVRNNNFAGMRRPGVPAAGGPMTNPSGWQSFDTPEAGIQGIANQLDRYASGATTGSPLTTIRQIVSTWAPPSENPTAQLIARASQVVGVSPDQPLDLSNPAVKGKLVEAMIRGEQGGNLPIDQSVITRALSGGGGPAAGAPGGQQMVQAGPQTATDAGPQMTDAQAGKQLDQMIPPTVHRKMSLDALVRQVAKIPGISDDVRAKLVEDRIKLLAPQEAEYAREYFDTQRAQRTETAADKRAARSDAAAAKRAETAGTRLLTTPEGLKEWHPGQPIPPGASLGGGRPTAAGGREQDIVSEIKRLDDEYAAANPSASEDEKRAAHFEHREKAEQGIADAKATPGRSPNAMLMRKYFQENPKATYPQAKRAVEQIIAGQAIERSFGSGQNANQLRSVNTVAPHLLTVRRYAAALAEGDTGIPRANALLQKLMVETGHPEVTNMNTASGIAADEIVRLLTSTGGTEQDRRLMEDRFKAAWSQGQLFGAIRVAEEFVAARFEALEQGYARNDPTKQEEFEQNMLIPDARSLYYDLKEMQSRQAGPTSPPGTTNAPAGPPVASGSPAGPAAGASQPEEVIHNPQTGEERVKRNGQWVPR